MSAVQPATPPIVMHKRPLKRAKLRIATLFKKLSRFHMNGNLSSNTRAPAFGDLGRNKDAGTCFVSLQLTIIVHIATGTTNASTHKDPYNQSYLRVTPGTVYKPRKILSNNDGIAKKPTISPIPPPIKQAKIAKKACLVTAAERPYPKLK